MSSFFSDFLIWSSEKASTGCYFLDRRSKWRQYIRKSDFNEDHMVHMVISHHITIVPKWTKMAWRLSCTKYPSTWFQTMVPQGSNKKHIGIYWNMGKPRMMDVACPLMSWTHEPSHESTMTGSHSTYHLVMTNIAMENPNHKWRFRSLGKSSISMGDLYHGYLK